MSVNWIPVRTGMTTFYESISVKRKEEYRMKTAKMKDTVTVFYTGRRTNGELFDAATEENPLRFELGSEAILKQFSAAIVGMAEGESKEFTLTPAQAFGDRRDELVQTLPRDSFAKDIDPKPGLILGMNIEKDGVQHKVPAVISKVADDVVTVDYNHPLAGETLLYQVTVKAIEK